MKKILTVLLAGMMAIGAAASNYQHSIGLVAGLGLGAQFKTMVTDHFTIFEEFGYFTCPNGGTGAYSGAIDNLVLAYQAKGVEGQNIQLDWYVGGQFKIGYAMGFGDAGLLGLGSSVGFEANMKNAPIAFSFDFRPGYAFQFAQGGAFGHMFDWSFNLGVRYTVPMAKAAAKKK